MRQIQNDTGALPPLSLRTNDEVIDDDLSSIGEVPELCLPNDQTVQVGYWVTVFKTKYTKFAEVAVADVDIRTNRLQEEVLGSIVLLVAK
jgi:hypothetical protein